jgi:hypothetical protein
MKLFSLCIPLCAMVVMSAGPVRAQNALWVSTTGNDANVCNQFAPCRTFQGAISKGNVVQINCTNSGNYGPVVITASITIDCGSGNVGTITSAADDTIQINATSPVNVVLRHLSLNGLDTAFNGILTTGGSLNDPFSGSLTVEDCTFQRYRGYAIYFAATTGRGTLQVSNSRFINNATGIRVEPSAGQIASVVLNRIEISGSGSNALNLLGAGVIAGTMRDSVIAASAAQGFASLGLQIFFTIEGSSIIANLSDGIFANTAGTNLSVTASTISGNGTGIDAHAGSIVSFGNNTLNGNGADGAFSSTIALK